MIHYHGLPMTPVLAMLRSMKGRHAMVSFENPEQLPEAAEICQSVALDCGSYSAWRQKKPYDFEGYKEWCRKWLRHPAVDWCVIPDVIDGTEEDNRKLRAQWLLEGWRPPVEKSVPVWHLHESLEELNYLARAYPRIALGSSGAYSDPGSDAWWQRMAEIMALLCDSDGYPIVDIHGMRMLDPVLYSHVPFKSADSCNAARNIGIDSRWSGPYSPASKTTRAIVMIDRIESHAAAARWNGKAAGVQQNMELLG